MCYNIKGDCMKRIVSNKGTYLLILGMLFSVIMLFLHLYYFIEIDINKNNLLMFIGVNILIIMVFVLVYLFLLKKSKYYFQVSDYKLIINTKNGQTEIYRNQIKELRYMGMDPFRINIIDYQDNVKTFQIGICCKRKLSKFLEVPLVVNFEDKRTKKEFKQNIKENKYEIIFSIVGLVLTIISFILHFKLKDYKIVIAFMMLLDLTFMFIQLKLFYIDTFYKNNKIKLKEWEKTMYSITVVVIFYVIVTVFLLLMGLLYLELSFSFNYMIFPCYLAPSFILTIVLIGLISEGI